MEGNYDKLNFGRTLASHDGDNNNHGDCYNYGSVSGCDEFCPALLRGDCEVEDEVLINLGMSKNDLG